MQPSAKQPLTTPSVEYGLATTLDLDAVTTLYVAAFPGRIAGWFRTARQAFCYYRDFLELLYYTHRETFFLARSQGAVAGFLILSFPEKRLLPEALRTGLLRRSAGHCLGGCYGFSPKLYAHILRIVLGRGPGQAQLRNKPIIEAVVVAPEFHGRGVGAQLMETALAACRGRHNTVGLHVEEENCRAVQLYERFGFRVCATSAGQHVMLCHLTPAGGPTDQSR